VIVKPGDRFDVTSSFVFLAQGIVDVDVDDVRYVGPSCLGDEQFTASPETCTTSQNCVEYR
jgi:hypothetical protein